MCVLGRKRDDLAARVLGDRRRFRCGGRRLRGPRFVCGWSFGDDEGRFIRTRPCLAGRQLGGGSLGQGLRVRTFV
jgi:hypothetical protein